MTLFLNSLGVRGHYQGVCWTSRYEDTWSEVTTKDYEVNTKAQYALTQALNDDDLSCVVNCKFAYEVWNNLIVTHEGTSQVKRSKIDLLRSQFENFYMLDNEYWWNADSFYQDH